ncbi:hypothetical protein STEG23_006625, partial [Scotinomys teguina]
FKLLLNHNHLALSYDKRGNKKLKEQQGAVCEEELYLKLCEEENDIKINFISASSSLASCPFWKQLSIRSCEEVNI